MPVSKDYSDIQSAILQRRSGGGKKYPTYSGAHALNPDAATASSSWAYQNPNVDFYTGSQASAATTGSYPSPGGGGGGGGGGYGWGGGGGGGSAGPTAMDAWNRDANWRNQDRQWMLSDRDAQWGRDDRFRNQDRQWFEQDRDLDWERQGEWRDEGWEREDRLSAEERERRRQQAMAMLNSFQGAMAESGAFDPRDWTNERNALAEAVAADTGRLNTAMDAAKESVTNVADPYAGQQAQATQVEASQAGLLDQLGGKGAEYEAEVAAANALGNQQAQAFNNTRDLMAANFAENQASRGMEIDQTRNFGAEQIGNQNRALQQAINMRAAQDEERKRMARFEAIMSMLPQMGVAGEGFDVGSLFGGA